MKYELLTESVKKGDTLLVFDVASARSEKETLTNQLDLEKRKLTEQLEMLRRRKLTLGRNITLTENILKRLSGLESGGAISELQVLQQENNLESQKDELLQLNTQETLIVNDSNVRSTELLGKLRLVEFQLENEYIFSPINGIVFDLKPDNSQYVLQEAEILMKVIPAGTLGAEVNISNQDIGFIHTGQKAMVRVDSFPFTAYGEIPAEIKTIGADTLPQ